MEKERECIDGMRMSKIYETQNRKYVRSKAYCISTYYVNDTYYFIIDLNGLQNINYITYNYYMLTLLM